MTARKPPKPETYYSAGYGSCRWCGDPILQANGLINLRANWHKSCVEKYRFIYFPKDTRRAVWARDAGKCYMCGEIFTKDQWEVEHIKPLYEAQGRMEYWELHNLGTACRPCHKKKTADEARHRALLRKKSV